MTGDAEPREFLSIEAAERSAGFAVPYPRNLANWHFASAKVRPPAFGVGDSEDVETFRFVTVIFGSSPPGRFFHVTSYRSDGTLKPIEGEGATTEVTVAGRRVLLYTSSHSFYANWLSGDLHVAIAGSLHTPESRSFTANRRFDSAEAFNAYAATLPTLDIEDILRIVEATR